MIAWTLGIAAGVITDGQQSTVVGDVHQVMAVSVTSTRFSKSPPHPFNTLFVFWVVYNTKTEETKTQSLVRVALHATSMM